MNIMNQFDTVANSEAGAKLHFTLPGGGLAYIDGDDKTPSKPLTVTMQGASSDAHKKLTIKVLRDIRAKSKVSKKKGADDGISDAFFEETAEAQVKRLVAVVTSWENFLDDKGAAIECNAKNVTEIFTKYQELRTQAINFLDADVNFIKS